MKHANIDSAFSEIRAMVPAPTCEQVRDILVPVWQQIRADRLKHDHRERFERFLRCCVDLDLWCVTGKRMPDPSLWEWFSFEGITVQQFLVYHDAKEVLVFSSCQEGAFPTTPADVVGGWMVKTWADITVQAERVEA